MNREDENFAGIRESVDAMLRDTEELSFDDDFFDEDSIDNIDEI